jgi:hypothetical protein
MADVGTFYGHLVYFVSIWYNVWLFGIIFPFWYEVPRKIWQPCVVFVVAFLIVSRNKRFGHQSNDEYNITYIYVTSAGRNNRAIRQGII